MSRRSRCRRSSTIMGPGSRYDRWLALEEANAGKAVEITSEQAAFIENLNPCFKERHVESASPGEFLCADIFFVGRPKGIGKVYLHAVVDSFSFCAFGFLHISKQPEATVAVLHNHALPFYEKRDLSAKAILTDNGREFCGADAHPCELYIELNGIEHRRTKVKTPKTNGFVVRFNGTVLDEFFCLKIRETFYDSVEILQDDLDDWLIHYNTERPHLGYRKLGNRPIATINLFISYESREDTPPVHRPAETMDRRENTRIYWPQSSSRVLLSALRRSCRRTSPPCHDLPHAQTRYQVKPLRVNPGLMNRSPKLRVDTSSTNQRLANYAFDARDLLASEARADKASKESFKCTT